MRQAPATWAKRGFGKDCEVLNEIQNDIFSDSTLSTVTESICDRHLGKGTCQQEQTLEPHNLRLPASSKHTFIVFFLFNIVICILRPASK